MNLLFSQENFSSEFKNLLGFVDADLKFNRLKSALKSATEEIIELIGRKQYELLLHEVNDSSSNHREYIDLIKYAIALKAYIIYAPVADLAVTNNGRLMRRDEHNVSAFQWQIEANNEGLERLYYRHLDTLLSYMVANDIEINQEKYRYSHLVIPNLATFENYFNIEGSHYLYLRLIPALREFEQNEILPRLGTELMQNKQRQIEIGIFSNIQNAAVCYAMAWGIRRLNVQLFPKGVLQTTQTTSQGTNKKQTAKLEYWETAKIFEDDYAKYLLKVEKIIDATTKINTKNKALKLPDLGFCQEDGFVDV